jgi:hypothetical protein
MLLLGQTQGGRTDVSARHAAERGAVLPTDAATQKNGTAGDFGRAAGEPLPDATLGATPGGGRTAAKAALMHYENQAIKLEMALRRHLRYEIAGVKREGHALGAMVRAGCERLVDQTAPRLAVMTNELDRRRLIERELRRLRAMLRRELPRPAPAAASPAKECGMSAPRYCGHCKAFLPADKFTAAGNDNWCRLCHREYDGERRARQSAAADPAPPPLHPLLQRFVLSACRGRR